MFAEMVKQEILNRLDHIPGSTIYYFFLVILIRKEGKIQKFQILIPLHVTFAILIFPGCVHGTGGLVLMFNASYWGYIENLSLVWGLIDRQCYCLHSE